MSKYKSHKLQKRFVTSRKRPPGQRLLSYLFCATAIVFLQGNSDPAELLSADENVAHHLVITQPFFLNQELTQLTSTLKAQLDKPNLRTGLFMIEPASGRYVNIGAYECYAAASMIKVPILVSLLIAADKKLVTFSEELTLRQDLIAGGSGYLQWRKPGSKLSLQEAAELMIINSDNTATNLIIDLLGGANVLNNQFAAWGLRQTHINNWLPDYAGENKTSPYDLAYLLGVIDHGDLISLNGRNFMLDIMKKTRTKTLLPPGLGQGATIFHKTGDIGSMVGDAGIIIAPNGVHYIVVAQVERPHNDLHANELIRHLSRTIYADLVPDAVFAPLPELHSTVKSVQQHRHHRHHQPKYT